MRLQFVRRTFILLLPSSLLFLGSGTLLANAPCDEITSSNKAYCSLIKFCQTLTDAEAKEECNRLAEEMNPNQTDVETESKTAPIESKPDAVPEAETTPIPATPVGEVQAEETPTTEETVLTTPEREVRVITEEIRLPSPESSPVGEPVSQLEGIPLVTVEDEAESEPLSVRNAHERLENKRRFAAAIIYYREVGFKSAILVLSNGLVFRSDYSALFKPEIGDVVNVRKRSVFSTVTYNLVGGKGGAMQVTRQRCEYEEMSQDTRRLCNLGQRVLDERSED